MGSEQGQSYLYDLDPPASPARRVLTVAIGCIGLGMIVLFIWFLMAPEPATGAASPEPMVQSILDMCSQSSIPRIFGDIAELALPLWSRLCNVVQN